jgi:hypothetical protein
MKSIKMLAGTLVLAAMAFAPVANAAEMIARPLTCNQKLINCIGQATINFECCATGDDPTTYGMLGGYCNDAPLPAFTAPASPESAATVPACLLIFNATTTACNVAYAICTVTHPSAPAKAAQ